jgi:hypothetical protein
LWIDDISRDNCGYRESVIAAQNKSTDLSQAPHTISMLQMKNQTNRANRLPSYGEARHTCEGTERLEPGRNVGQRIRMKRARATIMTRVECGEHFANLAASALPEHKSVRAHSKSLAQKPVHPDFSRTLKVGLAGFERHKVRMRDSEFRDVLDRHNAFGLRRTSENRRKQGRFARASCSSDENVRALCYRRVHKPTVRIR